MRRFKVLALSMVLVLAACFGVLTGCKDDSGNALVFWAYQPPSQADQNAFRQLIADFTAETGIAVKPNFVVKDNYNKVFKNSLSSTKNRPDIAFLDQPLIADYASKNQLYDMTSYVDGNALYAADRFYEGALETTFYKGKQYGIPLNITTSVLFYNKDLVPSEPESWDEWKAIGSTLGSGKALFEGIGSAGYASWYFQVFLENAGGKLVNDELTEITFHSQEGVVAAQMLQDLYAASPKNVRDTQNAFGLELVAFKLGSSSDIDRLEKSFPSFYAEKLGIMKIPPMTKGETGVSNIGGENLVILNNSSKKDQAKQLLEFLMREENMKKLAGYTGNFSAVKAYAETTDPFKRVVLEQLATARPRPAIANWLYVNDNYLATALENILAEGATASVIKPNLDTAAKDAADELF